MPRTVGLTSAGNQAFTQGLGCYDQVLLYEDLHTLDPATPTLYVDFAGNAALRRNVHMHFGDALRLQQFHRRHALGRAGQPVAACRARGRPSSLHRRRSRNAAPRHPKAGAGTAWRHASRRPGRPSWRSATQGGQAWVQIVSHQGADALQASYTALLNGKGDARHGLVHSLPAQPAAAAGR
jgi:hypothetical protein